MKMWEARVKCVGGMPAQPASAGWLFRREAAAGVFCVPAVKFMGADPLARGAEKIVLLRRKRHIAEARKLSRVKAAARQDACHGRSRDGLGQVHEAAALCDAGKAAGNGAADALEHRFVFTERFCVKLGIAAGQIETLQILRKCGVFKRAEIDEFGSEPFQQSQTVFIKKAERLVPCDTDAD